ncbi:NUP62 [Symbiodinium sp. CCMP2592]|nr:NUP62 [Symbiodinium sp. CCMP2592]
MGLRAVVLSWVAMTRRSFGALIDADRTVACEGLRENATQLADVFKSTNWERAAKQMLTDGYGVPSDKDRLSPQQLYHRRSSQEDVEAWLSAGDVCSGHRCDKEACPCGCLAAFDSGLSPSRGLAFLSCL